MASRRGGRWKISKAPTFLLGTFLVFWILDPGMQHVLHREPEGFRDNLYLFQSEVTLVQLPFGNPAADDVTDKLLDFLRRRFFQAPGGALNGVGEADDFTLSELRFWPAVAETFFAHIRDILLTDVHNFPTFASILLLLNGSFV